MVSTRQPAPSRSRRLPEGSSETAATRTRLPKADRRVQLLEAAEQILLTHGTQGITMERLAETAGVSKALPYHHFDNSDAVLVAVYDRVVGELGRRILRALDHAVDGADRRTRIRLLVRTYLDAVADIGPVLGVVTAPGSRAAELADADQRLGVRFLADVLERHLSVRPRRARLAAPVLLSIATGAIAAWVAGDGSRDDIEALMIDLFVTATE